MARPPGSPNADHTERREALLVALAPRLLRADPVRPSLRELAEAAGVQPNTLRHYFGDREGLVAACFAWAHRAGEPWMAAVRALAGAPLKPSLRPLLGWIAHGWVGGGGALGGLHAAGLAEGLGAAALGPAYVQQILEPSLAGLETVIAAAMQRGELRPGAPRVAALTLLSPVLLALLHQHELGGVACRPLDLDAFLDQHAEAWWRGWAASP